MMRSSTLAYLAFFAASVTPVSVSLAQFKFPGDEVPKNEAEYIAKARTAAPPSIANNATITMPQADGSTKVVHKGTNAFTCFILSDGAPECDDQNAMEWGQALDEKKPLPNKIGLIYMLAGDNGTSNHDSSHRSKDQHWVQTGPHVMIVGGAVVHEMLKNYPSDVDVKDPTQPYVMFPGKPNQHLMVPVHMEPVVVTGSVAR